MFSIEKCPIPTNTMLAGYLIDGAYTDCYTTEIPKPISFSEFVFAFYTTFPFKLERLILKLTVSKPSTDDEARQLADGIIEKFAAWRVESRTENEIMMCDFHGRTRSWFMITPGNTNIDTQTRLYFGSAVVPIRNPKTGKPSLGFIYQSLLGFHRIYSIILLHSAKSRVIGRFSSSV
jgi:hypothetical protein